MKWICLPQSFHAPDAFNLSRGIWYCPGAQRLVFQVSTYVRVAVNKANFYPGLKIDDTVLSMQPTLYFGHNWWYGGRWLVFFSFHSEEWVAVKSSAGIPREPSEWVEDGDTQGDEWYGSDTLPVNASAETSPSAQFSGRGKVAGSTKTVYMYWPRWYHYGSVSTIESWRSLISGVYTPVDGASGNLTIGVPSWRRSTDNAVFAHRTGGTYKNPITGATIVPVSDFDAEDETGDYCFSDNHDLRLRALPTDGSSSNIVSFDGETYTTVGQLASGGTTIALLVPDDGRVYYDDWGGGYRKLLSAMVPQWL